MKKEMEKRKEGRYKGTWQDRGRAYCNGRTFTREGRRRSKSGGVRSKKTKK